VTKIHFADVPAWEHTPKPSQYERINPDAFKATERRFDWVSMRITAWSGAQTSAQISDSSVPAPGMSEAGLSMLEMARHF